MFNRIGGIQNYALTEGLHFRIPWFQVDSGVVLFRSADGGCVPGLDKEEKASHWEDRRSGPY
jgi:hypothetical protein